MEKVPLTDTEVKNRANALTYSKALKLFNGGFVFDANTQKLIDDALAKYNTTNQTNNQTNNQTTNQTTNQTNNQTTGFDRSVRNTALDQEGESFAKDAEAAGFGTSALDAAEYQMMQENNAIFDAADEAAKEGVNLTEEDMEEIRAGVRKGKGDNYLDSSGNIATDDTGALTYEQQESTVQAFDPNKIDSSRTTTTISDDFRNIITTYFNRRGGQVGEPITSPNPKYTITTRTEEVRDADGNLVETVHYNEYGIPYKRVAAGEQDSDTGNQNQTTTQQGNEMNVVDFTAGQVADPTMPQQAIYDYTPQQINEAKELLNQQGFDLNALVRNIADQDLTRAQAGQATAPTSPGAAQATAALVGQPGTVTGETGTVSREITPQTGVPTQDALVKDVEVDPTGRPQIITKEEMPERTVTAQEQPDAATTTFDAKTYVGDTPQSTFVSDVNSVLSKGAVQSNELPPAATAADIPDAVDAQTAYNLTGDATFLAKSLNVTDTVVAQFIEGNVQAKDTVQGQLALLMAQFDDGTPTWAAGALRTANEVMAARGMGTSSIAGAAIVQAAMESALPIAQADAQIYANMNLTNLSNRQKVALEVAAAQRGTQLQNLSNEQQAELAKSTGALALNEASLSNLQSTQLANAQMRAALQNQNLSNTQQSNLVQAARYAEVANLNLSNEAQARLQDTTNNLQVDMANLSERSRTVLSQLQTDAALVGQQLTNEQQVNVLKSDRFFEANNLTFNAEQARVLSNSKMMETIDLENLDFEQARTVQNAATFAQMELTGLNNRQQAQVEGARNFLQMDLQNLSNTQQATILNYQTKFQQMLSDQAAKNTMEQLNVTSENEIARFYDNLAADISKFQAQLDTTISQFNAGQFNTIDQFNATMANNRDQFNITNQLDIAKSNAEWYRQINTLNTAGENAEAQVNAANYLNMSNLALANMWQEYRDTADQAFAASQNERDRGFQLAMAALQSQHDKEYFEMQVDAENGRSLSSFIWEMIT